MREKGRERNSERKKVDLEEHEKLHYLIIREREEINLLKEDKKMMRQHSLFTNCGDHSY